MLRPPAEAKELVAGKGIRYHHDEVLRHDPKAYSRFVRRALRAGLVVMKLRALGEIWVFFVWKGPKKDKNYFGLQAGKRHVS